MLLLPATGLRRFDQRGRLSSTSSLALTTLSSPMLAPTRSVRLSNVQLALPQTLHNLLAMAPQMIGSAMP